MSTRSRPIYLASSSPRRQELLRQVNIPFSVLSFRAPPRQDTVLDESPFANETAFVYAKRIACTKARFGYDLISLRKVGVRPVLAADTTVCFEDKPIGKPKDQKEAKAILTSLSGRSHQVITAIAIAWQGRIFSRLSVNEVRFRPIQEEEMNAYIATGEPYDKAGAYAIQGQAARFVEHLSGSYSGVMGLPLFETCELLSQF